MIHDHLGPSLDNAYALLMLASTAVFAVSFLMAKRPTQSEPPGVIFAWQSLVVTVCSIGRREMDAADAVHGVAGLGSRRADVGNLRSPTRQTARRMGSPQRSNDDQDKRR